MMASDSVVADAALLPETLRVPKSDEEDHSLAAASAVSVAAMFSSVATHDDVCKFLVSNKRETPPSVSVVLELLRWVIIDQTQ